MKGDREIEGIDIGVPGPLDVKRDLILNPPNLKYLWRCPLARTIEKSLNIKTRIDNDVKELFHLLPEKLK